MILPASGLPEGPSEVAAINDQTFLTTYFNDWRFLLQKIGNNQAMLHLARHDLRSLFLNHGVHHCVR